MVTPECEKLQNLNKRFFKSENSKTNNNQYITFTACFEFYIEMLQKKVELRKLTERYFISRWRSGASPHFALQLTIANKHRNAS